MIAMPSRKSHRKSRNGCIECKRRRVKCNERHPCQNCLKRDSQCVYSEALVPGSTANRSPQHPPRPIQNFLFAEVDEVAKPVSPPSPVLGNSGWTRDLELMHHFTAIVCTTLSDREDVQNVWGMVLPQISFSCDYLLHGILAFSALHIAIQKSGQNEDYLNCSMLHLNYALNTYRRSLSAISAQNCVSLFAFSSIIVVHVCALPGADGSGPSIRKAIALFNMCRGVETILRPYLSSIRESPMKPLLHNDYRIDQQLPRPPDSNAILPVDFEDRIARLRQFVAGCPLEPGEKSTYLDALLSLEISFDLIDKATIPLECGMAFAWPIMSPLKFIDFLHENKPLSLILLSYHCVTLNRLSKFWFLREWDKALLTEIWCLVPLDLRSWVEWPKAVCGVES